MICFAWQLDLFNPSLHHKKGLDENTSNQIFWLK